VIVQIFHILSATYRFHGKFDCLTLELLLLIFDLFQLYRMERWSVEGILQPDCIGNSARGKAEHGREIRPGTDGEGDVQVEGYVVQVSLVVLKCPVHRLVLCSCPGHSR
jgi:hypothetical protein